MGRFDNRITFNNGINRNPVEVVVKNPNIPFKIRYIEIGSSGSTANTGNHIVELRAYNLNGTVVSSGKPVTSNYSTTNYPWSRITDGNNDTALYADVGTVTTVDLQSEYDLKFIKLYRYYADSRTYYNTYIKVYNGDKSQSAFTHHYTSHGTYPETQYGRSFSGNYMTLGENLYGQDFNELEMYVGTPSGNKRITRKMKQTQVKIRDDISYSFGGWSSFFPNSGWGARSNASYFSQTNFNCTIPPGETHPSWLTYSWDLINTYGVPDDYGWAGTYVNTSNQWWNFYLRWPNTPKWLHNIVMMSVNSNSWQGCPSKTEVWAGDKATYLGTYAFTNPGAKNTNFYTQGIDYKPNGGIRGITLSIYDGAGWKQGTLSLRMKQLRVEGGDAYTTYTPVYETVTTWE